jgi:choline monooxygenase
VLNLDPAFYTAPGTFIDERDRIFAKTWQLLGPVSRLNERGAYTAAEIAGLKVFVVRGRDGALRGFRNVCRHRGARLLPEGNGRCGPIRCPYHNWAYDDEGRLLAAPWFGEDAVFRKEDWPLKPINVREWRGLVFVAIAPDRDLEHQLGDLITELADEPIESYQAVREERLLSMQTGRSTRITLSRDITSPEFIRNSSPRSISNNSRQPRMMGWCA